MRDLRRRDVISALLRFFHLYLQSWYRECLEGCLHNLSNLLFPTLWESRTSSSQMNNSADTRSPFVFTMKRALVLTMLGIVVPILMVWNYVCFFLDDVLYPDWRDTPVIRPVFLVGNARR